MNTIQKLRQAAEASIRVMRVPPQKSETPAGAPSLPPWRRLLRLPGARLAAAALAVVVAAGVVYVLARPPLVTVVEAVRGEAVDIVYATGVVDYVRQARVAPIVTAPIRRVMVEEGQRVHGGQLLAQLEDGPQRGTAAQLESQASTSRLAAARVERLYQRGFASRAAWDEARGQRNAAVAAAQSARARLSDFVLTAPFAATVLRRDAEPGDLAMPSRVLFVVADEGSLRVTADVDERDIARVNEGQVALIRSDAFPGQVFDAVVTEITPQGDASTRVFRVRLGLDPQTPFRAGMTVEANIISGRRDNAVLAPAAAARGDVIWVVSGSRVERRAIVRGASGDARVEISKGVAAGERVVVDPPNSLTHGSLVRVREAEPAPQ